MIAFLFLIGQQQSARAVDISSRATRRYLLHILTRISSASIYVDVDADV